MPMFETLVAFNLQEHLWGAAFDPPLGSGIGYVRLLSEHRRPYETQDSFICVLAVNDEQWKRLLPAIGRPELVDDERFRTVDARTRHIDTLYGVVAEQMKLKTTARMARAARRDRHPERHDGALRRPAARPLPATRPASSGATSTRPKDRW